VETDLLQKLGRKEITKSQLFAMMESDFGLLSQILEGTSLSKATIRYGCGSVLVDLSEKHQDNLYPYWDNFIGLLSSKYRILTWNAMAIIANLTTVDVEHKFDEVFNKYYSYLGSDYMVTVSNVVVNSAKIVSNKPYLANRIAAELLKVENLKVTPHLTEECKLVITEQAIKTFNTFLSKVDAKEPVVAFAQKHVNSSRFALRQEAQKFIKKWG
jgi:hypothetical protein